MSNERLSASTTSGRYGSAMTKKCTCCDRSYTLRQFMQLPPPSSGKRLMRIGDGGPDLYLANCECGSTLAADVVPDRRVADTPSTQGSKVMPGTRGGQFNYVVNPDIALLRQSRS